MTKQVKIPFGDNNQDLAVLLLAAAERLHGDQSLVETSIGAFVVPEDVAKEAGVAEAAVDADQPLEDAQPTEVPKKKAPAKKTTAKKTAAKKTAAKKAPAKKTTKKA